MAKKILPKGTPCAAIVCGLRCLGYGTIARGCKKVCKAHAQMQVIKFYDATEFVKGQPISSSSKSE